MMAFATITAACAPTEYESSWASLAAPLSTTTISACCVPTPPGVTGRSVVSEPTTITSSALRSVPGIPNASRNAAAEADAAGPAERAAGRPPRAK